MFAPFAASTLFLFFQSLLFTLLLLVSVISRLAASIMPCYR
jgi:hypothetical protein